MRDLIAPKPFAEYGPEEYRDYVSSMYAVRAKGKQSVAPGLSVRRTKRGALSIRRTKVRAFNYVTWPEIEALAKQVESTKADVWSAFKEKGYIICITRLEAEKIYAEQESLPW